MYKSINDYSDVDLIDVLKALQQETFSTLNVMKIGIIQEVLDNNEVKCSITNKILIDTKPDGSKIWREYPPIFAKVWFMGNAQTGINYPLEVGNPCLLLFNDREFNSYFSTGEISPLEDLRMHSLSDCICIPLFQANPSTDGITVSANKIYLNGELIINGKPYLSHVHSNGNQGKNTGGVVSV